MPRLLALLLPTVLLACTPRPDAVSSTSAAVGIAVREGQAVRLSDFTDFEWDVVQIFSPYTPRDDVCRLHVSSWPQCTAALEPSVPEGEFVLVFSLKGKYVAHESHRRSNGDYCETSCALVIPASEAVFRGQPAGGKSSSEVHYVLRKAMA